MSGFGLREQFEAARELGLDEKGWRDESFCHQLSMNGSLLLHPNHDRVWLRSLWRLTGRPEVGWSSERELLRFASAATVRRILWATSREWWRAMLSYRTDLARSFASRGILESVELEALDRRLLLVSRQLEELGWCRLDLSEEQIEVVEKSSRRR